MSKGEKLVIVAYSLLFALLAVGLFFQPETRTGYGYGGGDDWGAAQFPEEFEPRE